jgi:hypothetical protein
MEEFSEVSGLRVNPIKSTIWFSKKCGAERKEEVILAIQARLASDREKYLGIYVHHQRGRMDHTH